MLSVSLSQPRAGADPDGASSGATPGDTSARAGVSPQQAIWRLRYAVVCLLLTAFCFDSSSRLITRDSKLDLVVSPGRFLGAALQLWDSRGFAGQLQDQAYGYLFPMGPFFLVGHAIGLPAWVVQRLWWALLLCTAFLGVVVLARLLGIGTPLSRLVAGLAYACSPHVVSLLGIASVEVLPMCLAPWTVAALAIGTRGGPARRAGGLFGIAVLCMGGVNAAVDLAAVVPAVLFLLSHRVERSTIRLASWALVGAVLATLWWLVPLFLLGRYSPPFLDYIENAHTTTSTTSLVETLRGTADWLPYLPSTGARAGLALITQPALIVNSVIVAAVGLAALAVTRSVHRSWLVSCLCVGVVAITFGHASDVGSIFAASERSLLDGALAPLRNLHKFEPLVRLPLALGLADLIGRWRWGITRRPRLNTRVLNGLVLIAVIGAAAPVVALRLTAADSFTAVPHYWARTAQWLAAQHASGRALLVPGSNTGDYTWGDTSDEPLQALATSPWEVRDNLPLTPAGHVRMLDTVDAVLAAGVPSPALADYLERNGISYLVERNDLGLTSGSTVAPALVHAALTGSPGLERVRTFGPVVVTPPAGTAAPVVDSGLRDGYRAVEIWQVGQPDSVARVRAAPVQAVTQVSGGPEAVLPLLQQGVLSEQTPTVLTGQAPAALHPRDVVLTDGLRRREVDYGGAQLQRSDTLTAHGRGPLDRKVPDYLPTPGLAHQSVARYLGVRSVTASSSAADDDTVGAQLPADEPFAAVDGDASTAWVSAPGHSPVGQWFQLRFDHPTDVGGTSVTFAATGGSQPAVTGVTVSTSTGSVHDAVLLSSAPQLLRTPPGRTTSLRVTVDSVSRQGVFDQVGIRNLSVPGVHVSRTIVLPRDLAPGTRVDDIAFGTPGDARNGCVLIDGAPRCAVGLARPGEDAAGLDRTFTLPAAGRYTLSGTVTASPGRQLDALLARAAGYSITAKASSQAVPDPLAGAQAAVDADPRTGWIASATDPTPTLTLRWAKARTVSSLRIVTSAVLPATAPSAVTVTADGHTRSALIGPDGDVQFAPLHATSITLQFRSGAGPRASVGSSTSAQPALGIGVSEIVVPGLAATSRTASDGDPVHLGCGSGPALHLDGVTYPTSIDTTVGALRDLQPVAVALCTGEPVALAAGTHRFRLASTGLWQASAALLSSGATTGATTPPATVTTRHWSATSRTVHVSKRSTPTLLVVDENVNAGWQARADGHLLQPVTVDGWQQGYLVPAGQAVTVALRFVPQRTYALGLVGGALCVLVLLVLTAWRRRRAGIAPRGAPRPRTTPWIAGVVTTGACVLVGGAAGLVVALVVVGVAVAARGRRVRSGRALLGGAAFLTFAGAGIYLAAGPAGSSDYVANHPIEQVLCLIALAVAGVGMLGAGVDAAGIDRRDADGRGEQRDEPA